MGTWRLAHVVLIKVARRALDSYVGQYSARLTNTTQAGLFSTPSATERVQVHDMEYPRMRLLMGAYEHRYKGHEVNIK